MNPSKLIDFAYSIADGRTGETLSHGDLVRPPFGPMPEVSGGNHVDRLIHVHCPSGEDFNLNQEIFPLSTGDNPTQTVELRHEAKNRDGTVLRCWLETIWDRNLIRQQSMLSINIVPSDGKVVVGGDYNLGGHRDDVGPLFTSDDLEAHTFMFQLATVLRSERQFGR